MLLPAEPDYSLTFTTSEELARRRSSSKSKWATISNNAKSKPPEIGDDDFSTNTCDRQLMKLVKRQAAQEQVTLLKTEANVQHKDSLLIPLSPLQIFNFRVSPTILNFDLVPQTFKVFIKQINLLFIYIIYFLAQVTLYGVAYRKLRLKNKNDFSITVRMSSTSPLIGFPDGEMIRLAGNAVKYSRISLEGEQLGKLSRNVDCTINDTHSFKLLLTGTVVRKSLIIEQREITFSRGADYGCQLSIINKLTGNTGFQ